MKNTVLKLLSVRLALASFILAGLFLLAPSQVKAQTTNDLFSVPNVTFVSTQEAIPIVEAKILTIKSQYEVLTEGTQAYADNEIKYAFYDIILQQLYAGKTVRESLETALPYFGTDAAGAMSRTTMLATRTEAINLLKQ
ncbi:MAG: hypothetical protein ABIQ02_06065 [Saprospiraceae bacterium]